MSSLSSFFSSPSASWVWRSQWTTSATEWWRRWPFSSWWRATSRLGSIISCKIKLFICELKYFQSHDRENIKPGLKGHKCKYIWKALNNIWSVCCQDSLPKTSYFKIIDWILLVSVNSQIVVMIFHTYLYWACQEEFTCFRFIIFRRTLMIVGGPLGRVEVRMPQPRSLITQSLRRRTGFVSGSRALSSSFSSPSCLLSVWSSNS